MVSSVANQIVLAHAAQEAGQDLRAQRMNTVSNIHEIVSAGADASL